MVWLFNVHLTVSFCFPVGLSITDMPPLSKSSTVSVCHVLLTFALLSSGLESVGKGLLFTPATKLVIYQQVCPLQTDFCEQLWKLVYDSVTGAHYSKLTRKYFFTGTNVSFLKEMPYLPVYRNSSFCESNMRNMKGVQPDYTLPNNSFCAASQPFKQGKTIPACHGDAGRFPCIISDLS